MESAAQGGDDVERGAGDVVVARGARRRRRTDEEERERALEWARWEAEQQEWHERNPADEEGDLEEQERWDLDMAVLPLAKVGETREDECPICLEDFLPGGQKIRTMPCSHSFHHRCIFDWLVIDRRCPICRFVMPSQKRRLLVLEQEYYEGDEESEDEEDEEFGPQEPAADAAGDIYWSFVFNPSLPNNGVDPDTFV